MDTIPLHPQARYLVSIVLVFLGLIEALIQESQT